MRNIPFHRDYRSKTERHWWRRFDALPNWARLLVAESGESALDEIERMIREEATIEESVVELSNREKRRLDNKKRDQEKKSRAWVLFMKQYPRSARTFLTNEPTKEPPQPDKIVKIIVRETRLGKND